MWFLLTPERTSEVLVQWSKEDEIIVLPFSDRVLGRNSATGNEAPLRPLTRTLQLRAEGGTDFYTCGARALSAMKPFLDREHHLPAIVIMTDGKSQGAMSTFELPWLADGHRVPLFGVTFGDGADRSQLDNLANDRRPSVRWHQDLPGVPRGARVQLNAIGMGRNELDRGRRRCRDPVAGAGGRCRHAVLDRRHRQRRCGQRAGVSCSRRASCSSGWTPAAPRAARSSLRANC